jgi:hypothetical protein
MPIPESMQVVESVADKALRLNASVAGVSRATVWTQVERATCHLGGFLVPAQLTFIKDIVALSFEREPIVAHLISRIGQIGCFSPSEAAGSFSQVYPELQGAARCFGEVHSHVHAPCPQQLASGGTLLRDPLIFRAQTGNFGLVELLTAA